MVPHQNRGGFPDHVFEALQAYHDAGKMYLLLSIWRVAELAVRSKPELPYGEEPHWPAYAEPVADPQIHLATLGPMRVNLGLSDAEILARVADELKAIRENAEMPDESWEPARYSNRNKHFNVLAFGVVEVIDRHFLIGDSKEGLAWANVLKAMDEI